MASAFAAFRFLRRAQGSCFLSLCASGQTRGLPNSLRVTAVDRAPIVEFRQRPSSSSLRASGIMTIIGVRGWVFLSDWVLMF
jgi:hypothetical protein